MLNTKKGENIVTFDTNYIEENIISKKEKSKTMIYIIQKCMNNYLSENENKCYIKEIYRGFKDDIELYSIYGKLEKKDVFYIIYFDYNNMTFSIEKIEKTIYDTIKNGKIDSKYLQKKEIKNVNGNKFNLYNITDKQISEFYLDTIKNLIISNSQELYNLLDVEYKQNRFENDYKKLKEYCDLKKDQMLNSTINRYNANKDNNGNSTYTCIDNYNNTFIITEKDNDFSIMLDDYTVKTSEFKKSYEEANISKKAITNLEIFIKMINNKDYLNSYKLLDDTFKKNNFNSEEKYKEYLKEKFLNYNILTVENVEENSDIYIYKVLLKDSVSKAANYVRKTINIKLLEGTNFVMSFNVD